MTLQLTSFGGEADLETYPDELTRAEGLGSDSIWCLDHHFTGYIMSSAPTQLRIVAFPPSTAGTLPILWRRRPGTVRPDGSHVLSGEEVSRTGPARIDYSSGTTSLHAETR
jgi:hypothetical protein